ncbi:MAG: AMP-binding protein, partial [Burkholderiales bacterium]|nr:AMP-binding protein [Burkholderiales bacterium]
MQSGNHTPEHIVAPTPSAYDYPLLVKQLLVNALAVNANQEITYRGRQRYSYDGLYRRIGQLAHTLTSFGAKAGSTVAVMDWDTHRYLESYFAIPMMGATLFTVNVRISPRQIAYTLNDSGAQILIVNAEFLPLLEQIWGSLTRPPLLIVARDDDAEASIATSLAVACDYEPTIA